MGTESSFSFLTEQWKARVPPGYTVGEASVDQPFEEDPCNCHFIFNHANGENHDLALSYQWYVGGRTPVKFSPIDEATDKVLRIFSLKIILMSRIVEYEHGLIRTPHVPKSNQRSLEKLPYPMQKYRK
jgi:hypothetical protein